MNAPATELNKLAKGPGKLQELLTPSCKNYRRPQATHIINNIYDWVTRGASSRGRITADDGAPYKYKDRWLTTV